MKSSDKLTCKWKGPWNEFMCEREGERGRERERERERERVWLLHLADMSLRMSMLV